MQLHSCRVDALKASDGAEQVQFDRCVTGEAGDGVVRAPEIGSWFVNLLGRPTVRSVWTESPKLSDYRRAADGDTRALS